MSDPLKPPTTSSDFEQHPPGSYMAVCADVYVKEEKNNFFGKPKDKDKPHILDDRQTVTKAYVVFLTSHPDKNGKPSYVNSRQSFTWGGADKPSNLFKLVKGWFSTGTDDQIRNMSLTNLVGKNAWITVEHNKNNYASVTAASTPPPGVQPVAIPADFKRYEQKQAEQPVATPQVHQPVQHPVFTAQTTPHQAQQGYVDTGHSLPVPPPTTQYPGTVMPPQAPMPTQQPQHITSEHDDLPW